MTIKAKPRFEYIDVLRGIAIISVFLYHVFWNYFSQLADRFENGFLAFSTYSSEFWVLYPLSFGWLGVPLFFLLSGFSIYYSYLKMNTLNKRKLSVDQMKIFYLRRIFRIVPAYFFCLFLAWVLTNKDLFHIFYHGLFIHNFNRETFFSINPSFWSIAHEWQYYLIFPLFIWLSIRFGLKTILFISLAISVLITLWFMHMDIPYHDKFLYWNVAILWYQWIAGAYLAEQKFVLGSTKKPAIGLLFLLPLIFVLFTWFKFTYMLSTYIAVWWFYLIIDRFSYLETKAHSKIFKAFAFIGTISFSFYLLHQPLLRIFFTYWNKYVFTGLIGVFTGIPVVFIITGICSYILYQMVEKPSQEFCKRWIENHFQ